MEGTASMGYLVTTLPAKRCLSLLTVGYSTAVLTHPLYINMGVCNQPGLLIDVVTNGHGRVTTYADVTMHSILAVIHI